MTSKCSPPHLPRAEASLVRGGARPAQVVTPAQASRTVRAGAISAGAAGGASTTRPRAQAELRSAAAPGARRAAGCDPAPCTRRSTAPRRCEQCHGAPTAASLLLHQLHQLSAQTFCDESQEGEAPRGPDSGQRAFRLPWPGPHGPNLPARCQSCRRAAAPHAWSARRFPGGPASQPMQVLGCPRRHPWSGRPHACPELLSPPA
mmetsp:Transcript_98059/g.211444  ORF Transcript_98059/g.211444 Transcript_98059/m.211444 type:complete len:204 (+) Transcript_98059:104-715(+)